MLRTRNRRHFLFDHLEPRLAMTGFYVSPTGDDVAGDGTIDAPWRTIPHAVASAAPGDVINLREGDYEGGIFINKPNITIQSYPGDDERATLTASADVNNLYFYFDAGGSKALNLDLIGGFYGVKFDQNQGGGTVDGCKITGTAYWGIKVVPGVDDITIARTEVANTGLVYGGGGIDDVNGDRLTIRDCYIHDVQADAIMVKGGASGAVIERNRIVNSGGTGIDVGQATGGEFFDPIQNPDYYEIIRPIVRNNIVVGTDYAGIAIYAAQQPQVYNNTLVDTARVGQASIFLTTTSATVTTEPSIVNNIVTRTVEGVRPLVHITANGFTGTLTMDHNRYHNAGAVGGFWDERSWFYGGFEAWRAHIGAFGAESHSTQGDPGLDATGHLVAGSPSIDAGRYLGAVPDDIDGVARAGAYDIGADEYGGAGPVNRPPVAVADAATTLVNDSIRITVLANDSDPDGNPLTVTATTDPAHGSVVINADQTVTYKPSARFFGTDTFSYTISDGRGGTTTAIVTVTVNKKIRARALAFEDIPLGTGGMANVWGAYQESGSDFVLTGDFQARGDGASSATTPETQPGSGRVSTSLVSYNSTTTLTNRANLPFSLLSIDLAREFFWNFPTNNGIRYPVVTFTGTKADGSTVTQRIDVDQEGFSFKTFTFTGFTDLVSVTWDQPPFSPSPGSAGLHQFDNIVVGLSSDI